MLPGIAFLTVLRDIEALDLMIFRDTQANDDVDHLKDHQRSDYRQPSCNSNTDGLIYELMGVSFQSAGSHCASAGVFENGIDSATGEDAGQQRSDCAAGA